jgi:hypothetical protein
MRTLWKFRLLLILAALVLVIGGGIALAAKDGSLNSNPRTSSSGTSAHDQEPTETDEATRTPGTEPTETEEGDQEEISGTITSLDCAQGSITIKTMDEEAGGTFTAVLTSATVFTINGKAATCADLQVGAQVSIEATRNGTTWTATRVSQGENDQGEDGQGGTATPTPGDH